MPEPYGPYPPPPYYDRPYWRHAYRRSEPPFLGPFIRFAIGLLVLLILVGVLRAVVESNGGNFPWAEVGGGLGVAIALLGGLLVFAIFLALIFGFLLPALSGRHGDWMNPARWSNFEAVKDLKMRYARGEISREEYMRILRDLEPESFAGEAPPPNTAEVPK